MLRNIIAEIDIIAKDLEDIDQLWAFNMVWKLDKIAQELEEVDSKNGVLAKIDKKILSEYMDKMTFLTENENKLVDIISQKKDKNAAAIYRVAKKHFGSLSREESISFINKILEKQ